MKLIAVKLRLPQHTKYFLIYHRGYNLYDRLKNTLYVEAIAIFTGVRTPDSCNLIHLDNLGLRGNILAATADSVNQLILNYKD